MRKCDNSKIHVSNNSLLSICLLIMLDTLLLVPSLHCNTLLHFTTLHQTTHHYTYRHFTSSHLHFTILPFGLTHLHFLSFYYVCWLLFYGILVMKSALNSAVVIYLHGAWRLPLFKNQMWVARFVRTDLLSHTW